MSDRVRNIVIVIVIILCALGMNVLAWGTNLAASDSASAVKDLSATLNRRSPVIDYITASNETSQCRDFYRYLKDQHQARFLVDIASRATDEEIVALISLDEEYLRRINELCPYPKAPQFDNDGHLIGESPMGPPPPTTLPTPSTTTQPGG